jgi:hypothetical protein
VGKEWHLESAMTVVNLAEQPGKKNKKEDLVTTNNNKIGPLSARLIRPTPQPVQKRWY